MVEFLLTNVTSEPSTFIVWLQQMCLELFKPCKTTRTVSTWVRLFHQWIRTWQFRFMFVLNSFPQKGHKYGLLLLCTWRLCSCKWLDSVKLLSHRKHLYGLSPVWTLMCLSRLPDWLNILSHTSHLYGFSPLWLLLCLVRLAAVENCLLQTVHSNNFSPEWLRLCTARCWLDPQHLPHTEHLYLLVWIFIWWWRLSWDEKTFSHWLQVYVTPACNPLCLVKFLFVVNRLSHTVHKFGLGLSSLTSASVLISILTSNVLSPV